jgi:uncharacterized protein YdhG (YjbR/CyaY superfamily)
MDSKKPAFASIDEYIASFPADVQARLQELRAIKDELAVYEGSKGTVQFPFDRPLPHDLIRRIVQFRVEENLQKAAAKAQKKKP